VFGVLDSRKFQLGDALKRNTLNTGRLALRGVAAAAMLFSALNASGLGLGRLSVQSGLGETLKAEIEVTSLTPEESSNLKVRVAPPEAYRAAGVDYNAVLPATQVAVQRRPDGRTFLRITSNRAVQEPFVDVILELNWSTGRLVREYTLLFDPPSNRTAAPAPVAVTTEPAISSAPPPAPSMAVTPPSAPTRASRPSSRPAPMAVDAPVAAAGGDQYTVKPGDTLSRIAGRTQRPGVSLDQMLVSLYKGNPDAFLGNNMNRLRSGVVLSVPSADAAKAISSDEAKQVIQAQSADFNAFRQRLAGSVPAAKTEASSRQAKGAVQATVDDKKQASAPVPDKLTLTKGAASPAAKAASEEAKISKEKEKAAAAARVAELSKNVEDLKKLQNATATASPAPTAPVAAKPPVVVASAPAVSVPTVPVPVPVVVPEPPPVVVQAPPPAPVASEPIPAVVAASEPAPVVVPAPPAPVVTPAPAALEPSFVDGILNGSNPLGLAVGGGLIALLAGFGLYRFSKRAKRDSGETSFLESRLQPDSFFGASGGQRIDTRDASGASSSMSYSLSQLDAIGDVDPVAEADVYLAYGRDLQAEEILKEAMRGNPDRLAIRTKLLEVYAKRRDTKGFEVLATQLFSLTQGSGEDWAKAQEMGMQIDPENPLYRPGGAPSAAFGSDGPTEPLGASTMPQSVLPPVEVSADTARSSASEQSLDLDLELDLAAANGAAVVTTQPGGLDVIPPAQTPSVDLDFTPAKAAARAASEAADSAPSPLDFDLGAISLDLDAPTKSSGSAAVEEVDTGSDEDDGRDPLERKLDLAEEFRQIGDMEGARDLLQEVVAKGTGSLRSKAQSMLNALS
jgi:pilus assembly protein FimV